jgi:DNA-binding NtrC family response regulator
MSKEQPKAGTHPQAKVIIADDQRVLADTLAVILQWGGFQTLAVYSAENAIQMAAREKPDLLITDVVFRGESHTGIDVALRVRELLPDCKILLFSGDDSTAALLEKAKADGHEFQFLQKPVYPQDVLSTLGISAAIPSETPEISEGGQRPQVVST